MSSLLINYLVIQCYYLVSMESMSFQQLPLEKKARLMEAITEQHHEHLTEEEKKILAQIRSVAATLYE